MRLPDKIHIRISEQEGLFVKTQITSRNQAVNLTPGQREILLSRAGKMYIDDAYYTLVEASQVRDNKGRLVEFDYVREGSHNRTSKWPSFFSRMAKIS